MYVLSIGPAVKIAGPSDKSGYPRFYTPLRYLGTTCPPFDRFIRWYMRQWTN
jgi:hypothetical protein